jgi:hypothetical protein
MAPIARFLDGPSVMRPCPDAATLKLAFTRSEQRRLRRSDGTLVLAGRRFEVPNRYRHLADLEVRFADWDLSLVHLVDEASGNLLCRLYPQDKAANADGRRRTLEPVGEAPIAGKPAGGMAPLLAGLIKRRAATGLPPAYLVKDEGEEP